MIQALKNIVTVARNKLVDSVRSRRALIVFLLYVAGAILLVYWFINILSSLEGELANVLKVQTSPSASGTVADTLWKSNVIREMVTHVVRDREVAKEVITMPLMAVYYAGIAFAFTPLLVILITSGRIAEEVSSGSARFVLFRVSRAAWCMGKFFGQALMVMFALMLSAIAAWCVAGIKMPVMTDLSAMRWMILYAFRVWIYSFAFIGLATGVSLVAKSANQAVAFAFGLWIFLFVIYAAAGFHLAREPSVMWETILTLTPHGHRLDMWRNDPAHLIPAMLFFPAQGLTFVFAGYAFFSRKDL